MKILYSSVFLLCFISCTGDNKQNQPGICLSFDDRSVEEWFELRELFSKNGVKATFYITQPDALSNSEIRKLKKLEADGHEIGFHGRMHVLSEYYIKEHSYLDYLENEINLGLKCMDSLGFSCVSFAYPYGAEYWFTDFLLLQKFQTTRGVSVLNEKKDLAQIEDIYYSFDGDRKLSAVGIDRNSGINEAMIDTAIQRVIDKKEVLMLYAHVPTNKKEANGYTLDINLLKHIIQKANQNNLRFYKTRDLSH